MCLREFRNAILFFSPHSFEEIVSRTRYVETPIDFHARKFYYEMNMKMLNGSYQRLTFERLPEIEPSFPFIGAETSRLE